MTESQDRPSHHVLDLLASLGFQKTYRYGQHAVVYEFKEFTFEATEHPVNDKFQHVILFTGIYRDRRVIAEIKHEIPPFMDDIRTLKALLFYMVGSYVTFDPPYWLQEGEKFQYLLPWNKEHYEYQNRPVCFVERDWFRVARWRIINLARQAHQRETVSWSFDGERIRIEMDKDLIVMPARGERWESTYTTLLGGLVHFPRRFTSQTVEVGVWGESLWVDRLLLNLIDKRPASS